MAFYIYILYSSSRDKYYIGYSEDADAHLIKHNLGSTPSTRPGRPWILVYTEECKDKSTAIIREREIKSMKSRKYIENLIAKNS